MMFRDEDRDALQLYCKTAECLEASRDDKEVGPDRYPVALETSIYSLLVHTSQSITIVLVADVLLGLLQPRRLLPNYGGAQLSKISNIYQLLNYLMASRQQ